MRVLCINNKPLKNRGNTTEVIGLLKEGQVYTVKKEVVTALRSGDRSTGYILNEIDTESIRAAYAKIRFVPLQDSDPMVNSEQILESINQTA